MHRLPDPELLDADAPEATDEWFAKARPAAEVLDEVFRPSSAEDVAKH